MTPPDIQGRLWARQMKGHKGVKDAVVPALRGDPLPALREAMREMDLSMPVWLPRHQKDWEQYALTRFLPEHFMESVAFDKLEVSFIFPEDYEKPKRVSEYDD